MTLILDRLFAQIEAMTGIIAGDREYLAEQQTAARAALRDYAEVTGDLRVKLAYARVLDSTWRGAEPLGASLDERHLLPSATQPATLIAADGSQIYPNRHGIALYYLINLGSIILRQESGEAPEIASRPAIFYREAELHDPAGRLRGTEYVDGERSQRELLALAELAEAERAACPGDRPILALTDGPLLGWSPKILPRGHRLRTLQQMQEPLDRLRAAGAIPVGYVDRPGSSAVLRTLELAGLTLAQINRDSLRYGPYRQLADRALFADLAPGERTGLFASLSAPNERYARLGHRVLFFYLNVSHQAGERQAVIARIELPLWAAPQADLIAGALYADCAFGSYPYVLVRAHELAVVSERERRQLEDLLAQSLLRQGLLPAVSAKALFKRWTGTKGRRKP